MSDFAQLAAKVKEDSVAEPAAAGSAGAAETPAQGAGEEGADGDAAGATAPEEESTAQFEPVVQLEEVEVKTHEEDEEVLWKIRAKLFIFGETLLNKGTGQKEWVERGIGEVKFLQHKANKFIRLLMRQEKTMKVKVCSREGYTAKIHEIRLFYGTKLSKNKVHLSKEELHQEVSQIVICNHVADPRIVLKPNAGSDRSWVWNAFDFTDGELEETTFALRFGNSDTAKEFEKQFLSAQKVVTQVMTEATEGESAPTAEPEAEAAEPADPCTDAAADALKNLSVGGKEGEDGSRPVGATEVDLAKPPEATTPAEA